MTAATKGIWLMVATVAAFAAQDGFSRLLAGNYNTLMVVAFRYWVFAAYVLVLALRRPEGVRAAIRSGQAGLQVARGVLLVAEILLMVWAYTLIGLIEAHAVFAFCPLIVAGLSGWLLGERISRARVLAIGLGLVGVLITLRPGLGLFTPAALLPLGSAVMFALYSVLTRKLAVTEPSFAVFFWPAIIGAGVMTGLGLPAWEPVAAADWPAMIAYALVCVLSNWLLQKCYETTEAARVQPYAYLQIVFVTVIGIVAFGESLAPLVALGSAVVIGAGLFALAQERRERQR